jgi:hypothetical protein
MPIPRTCLGWSIRLEKRNKNTRKIFEKYINFPARKKSIFVSQIRNACA